MKRDALMARREAAIHAVIKKTSEGVDLASIAEAVKHIESLDKVIEYSGKRARRELLDGVIVLFLLCLALAVLLSVRPTARAQIFANVAHVEFFSISLSSLQQGTYSSARAVGSPGAFAGPIPGTANITIGDIAQGSPSLAASIGQSDNCDYIKIDDGIVTGTLWDRSNEWPVAYPFTLNGQASKPASLRICGARSSPLQLLASASRVSLSQQATFGNSNSEPLPVLVDGSAIIAGRTVSLQPTDIVAVVPSEADADNRLHINFGESKGIRISYAGSVSHLFVGPPRFAANQTPTALERIVRSGPWTLVFAAVGGSFGVLWSIRKILRGI